MSEHAPNGVPPAFQRGSPPCTHELPQLVLEAMTSTETVDPLLLRQYQSLVGALLYCSTNTRPDIAYAVNVLCRAMSRPTSELMDAAMRVLYYLHVHREIGLRYQADDKAIKGMSDSDWAVRHSVSGWLFMYSPVPQGFDHFDTVCRRCFLGVLDNRM